MKIINLTSGQIVLNDVTRDAIVINKDPVEVEDSKLLPGYQRVEQLFQGKVKFDFTNEQQKPAQVKEEKKVEEKVVEKAQEPAPTQTPKEEKKKKPTKAD